MPSSRHLYFPKTENYAYCPELEKEFGIDDEEEPRWAPKAAAAMLGSTNSDLKHANKNRKFWNGSEKAFLAGSHKTEWGASPLIEKDTTVSEEWLWPLLHEDIPPRGPIVLDSLLDIARPAKRKGVSKEYEVMSPPPRVIALEFDEVIDQLTSEWEEDWDSEEESVWEELEDFDIPSESKGKEAKKSYASIVKGQGR